ncbi:Shedu anti-phage system protein SduA domain-containing protein [Bacillus thuringiensis]|uniref:Shedu anti-phage system protein SduA domain-containing protein n=1 Tax=Bacillus thuringiensis TaxID=1428 RepID=UPI000BFA2533|nr:Shedu anti-phage system protein SduA domain-containing protein [Bacillus thuringiensis]MED3269581.1 DUF4263 domain-containing protein [Bacillus thuringiensis]PFV45233.1 hypothetical protein COL14_26475 [Bacillus thuringiensis]
MTKQNKQRIFIDAIKPNYFDKELHHLRYYQRDAVKAVWESLRNDRNEMLIEMAIGTGKMRVAMALINLFLEYGFSKKILFLSSMEVMQQQVLIKFTGDFEEYTVSHLNDDDGLWKRAHIVVSTYQKVREYSLAGNEFDLVICDQADEISYTNLNEIFSVFNTCIIGFVQSDQKFKLGSNLEKSFNTDKLIYSYTLHNAIYDGYVNNINSISNINLEKNIYIEINQKIKHIKETLLLDSKEISSLEEVAISLEAVSKAIKDYGDLRQEMVKSGLDKGDIKLLGNKKEQLENFKMLLKDSNYKDNQEVSNNNSLEGVWQKFFEKNTWIFGYGLNYIFNSPLDNKKLEQVISGNNFNQSGKRIDTLMKTRGLINSMCFVEIKTHKTPLLDRQYRNECWEISRELSGAIAQIQRYKYKALKDISSKTIIKAKNGDPTGEVIFNYSPRLVLVIGNLNEFITGNGINEDKLSSFEMFRKSIEGIDIITFDELYERAKYIIES